MVDPAAKIDLPFILEKSDQWHVDNLPRLAIKGKMPDGASRQTEAFAEHQSSHIRFGVSGGRIAEIAVGKPFRGIKEAGQAQLPPPGPYPTEKQAVEARKALDAALDALAAAEASLAKLAEAGQRASR